VICFCRTIVSGGCLKSPKTNNKNRIKKSVHFDWHMPREIRSTSPSTHSNYRLPVTVTSSFLSTSNISNTDNDEQRKKNDGEAVKEKEKIETTRRTIITTTPLTTHTIHRSFSLSPSPQSKEEKNDSRRHREEKKKENVDKLNSITSPRVTTAATHLYCTTNDAASVTFNDDVSQLKEPNGTNNHHTSTNDPLY
jgi:hypothetical protein